MLQRTYNAGAAVLLLAITLTACAGVRQSSVNPESRKQYCEPLLNYCVLYPDTFRQLSTLEEQKGVLLDLDAPDCTVTVEGFKNAMYQSPRDWYEGYIQEVDDRYESFLELEANFTDDIMELQLLADGELHLIRLHRLGIRTWVLTRLEAENDQARRQLIALWNRMDIIPNR